MRLPFDERLNPICLFACSNAVSFRFEGWNRLGVLVRFLALALTVLSGISNAQADAVLTDAACNGDIEQVRRSLKDPRIEINDQGRALYCAIDRKRDEVFKLLMADSRIDVSAGNSAVILLAFGSNQPKYYEPIANHATFDVNAGSAYESPLYQAMRERDIAAIEFLFRQPGFNPNRLSKQRHPLMDATDLKDEKIFDLLLQNPQTDINIRSETVVIIDHEPVYFSVTPLEYAIHKKADGFVSKLLLDKRLKIEKHEKVLGFAAHSNSLKLFAALLEMPGINITQVVPEVHRYGTPLWIVAFASQTEMLKLLVKAPKFTMKDPSGDQYLFMQMIRQGYLDVFEILAKQPEVDWEHRDGSSGKTPLENLLDVAHRLPPEVYKRMRGIIDRRGQTVEEVDNLEERISVTGVAFKRLRKYPELGMAFVDPSGLIWAEPKSEGIYYLGDAVKYCVSIGARLPQQSEAQALFRFLGVGTKVGYSPWTKDKRNGVLPDLSRDQFLLSEGGTADGKSAQFPMTTSPTADARCVRSPEVN